MVTPAPSKRAYFYRSNYFLTFIPTSLCRYLKAFDFCLVSDSSGLYIPGALLIFLHTPYQNLGSALIVAIASLMIDFSNDSSRVMPWCSLPGDLDLILFIIYCPSNSSSFY
jgi:hypothetical protein